MKPSLTLLSFVLRSTLLSLIFNANNVVGERSLQKKNILVLLTDDQDVVLGGADHMENVKRYIAEEGTTFTNAFVHTPICCPSRSTMLSGRYLHNGAAHNNSISGNCDGTAWKEKIEPHYTYAVEAQKAGYTTVYAGKYLNQYGILPTGRKDPNPRVPAGWDHWFGLVGNSRYYDYSVVVSDSNGTESTIKTFGKQKDEDYLPHVLQNYTLGLLPKLPEPWLMVVAWPSPHSPFTPASWAVDQFGDLEAPITPNFNASASSMMQKHWLMRQLTPITEQEKKEHIDLSYHRRLETLLTVDEHVGQLHSLLSILGIWDHTVALYTSDNGFQFGQHRLAIDKRHLYENDIRIPFFVRGLDGVWSEKNTTSTDVVVSVDIAPTLWDVMQGQDKLASPQELPSYMDGVSLLRCPHRNGCDRRDFLVSYNGEADPRCGLADCPIPSAGSMWYMPDSWNNTYHCVRTVHQDAVKSGENTIFCSFMDDEDFVEYYNLKTNPYQLDNDIQFLSDSQAQVYKDRLKYLLSCRGVTCRSFPDFVSTAASTA